MLVGKKLIISLGLVIVTVGVFLFLVNVYTSSRYNAVPSGPSQVQGVETRVFTTDELKKYDGSDPDLPIYLAHEGLVYDVTDGKQFYAPGGSYHYLAGKDSTIALKVAGGDIIKKKYPVVGRLD